MWDKYEWWPVWDPIPRKPWRLVNERGESKRDRDGRTVRFNNPPNPERKNHD